LRAIPDVRINLLCAVVVVLLAVPVGGQEPRVVRQRFEAGQFDQVVAAADAGGAPSVVYLAVLSQQKLGASDKALDLARRLETLPEDSAWRWVGESVAHLLEGRVDLALAAARRGVELDGRLVEAHLQLGLVLAKQEAWKEAAAAFDRAAELDPSYAYAYYYAGLMHYRGGRPDLMASRFERFLKLAPDAPERPEVLQTMRAIRGR
jgi:tetratricopeptide (TPR) repeat protein